MYFKPPVELKTLFEELKISIINVLLNIDRLINLKLLCNIVTMSASSFIKSSNFVKIEVKV